MFQQGQEYGGPEADVHTFPDLDESLRSMLCPMDWAKALGTIRTHRDWPQALKTVVSPKEKKDACGLHAINEEDPGHQPFSAVGPGQQDMAPPGLQPQSDHSSFQHHHSVFEQDSEYFDAAMGDWSNYQQTMPTSSDADYEALLSSVTGPVAYGDCGMLSETD